MGGDVGAWDEVSHIRGSDFGLAFGADADPVKETAMKYNRIASGLVLTCLLSASSYAQPLFYVSATTGSDETGLGTMEAPWATIGHAISEVEAGMIGSATLMVAGGRYIESILIPDGMSVIGRLDAATWQYHPDMPESYVEGLTECQGSSDLRRMFFSVAAEEFSRGIVCSGEANVRLRECKFGWNSPPNGEAGGGLWVKDFASAYVWDSTIERNGSPGGYIIRGGGLALDTSGDVHLERCVLRSNGARNSEGGAIYAKRGTLVCRDCVFTHNGAAYGSSIYEDGEASVTLINCRFTDNAVEGPWGYGWD